MKNKWMAVVLLCVCLLSGCGRDGAHLVEAANEKMQQWESYGFSVQTIADVDIDEIGHIKLVAVSDGAARINPELIMKMDSNITMQYNSDEQQQVEFTQYAEDRDGLVMLYQNSHGAWTKGSVQDKDLIASTTKQPSETLENYMESMKSATIIGNEKINGVRCVKVKAVLSVDAMEEILHNFSAANQMGIGDKKAFMQNAEQEITTIFWIGKEDFQLYKQEVDLSEVMKDALLYQMQPEEGENPDLSRVIMNMSILYYDIDAIDSIAIPKEAKNAPSTTIQP